MSRDIINHAGKQAFSSFTGWGISTMLLWLLRRSFGNDGSSAQEPSKFTYDNINAIGSAIPVVIGRGMIKTPLVSYYGDYDYKIYTEEYGAHSKLNVWPMILATLINLIVTLMIPSHHVVITNTGGGTATDTTNGIKMKLIVNAVVQLLVWLLMQLISKHLLKTTIQKGFKYYLGWQHIICWTGDNIGIKKIYMNVYDDNVEESTEKGVWDNNDHVAWKVDNPTGIVAHIDDEDMFGGPDENGGFVGDIRLYFGTREQGRDSWMVQQMTDNAQVEDDLKGLTPVYPMYFTCVIPKAYIGKQPNIPEMWFEIVNYPNKLWTNHKNRIIQKYRDDLTNSYDYIKKYLSEQDQAVKDAIEPYKQDVDTALNEYRNNLSADEDDEYEMRDYNNSWKNIKDEWKDMKDNYPNAKSAEFARISSNFDKLIDNGRYHLGRLGDDENPADAIYEILKNNYWGCDYGDTRIDVDSLINLGATCELEGLGVSCVFNQVDIASSYINKILQHINGVCFDSPTTGMLTFKLIRNDYDVDNVIEFNTSNCENMEFTRLDWSETVSAINVNFTDANNKYDTSTVIIQDTANTFITHNYNEQDSDGQYFTTVENARTLAQTSLLSAGYPLASVMFKCNRIGYNVTMGDPIRLNWPPYGITKQAFRVTDIDYGSLTDETITITAVEDVFGFGKVDYDYHGIISWEDTPEQPTESKDTLFVELPYEMTLSLNTSINGYASRPTKETRSWFIYKYKEGQTKVTARSTTFSMIGSLNTAYPLSFETDTNGFEISHTGVESAPQFNAICDRIADDPDTYNNKSSQNIVMIGDEIMSYDKMELMPNGSYKLTGIIRGIFDTLPQKHTENDSVIFLNTGLSANGLNYACKEGDITVDKYEVRTASVNGEQDFDLSNLDTVITKRRSEAPTVMANMKFGMDRDSITEYKYVDDYDIQKHFTGDLVYSFIPRNKFDNYGIISQTDDTTVVVTNVNLFNTVTIEAYDKTFDVTKDVAYDQPNGVSKKSMRMKWVDFCNAIGDDKLKQYSNIHMTVHVYDEKNNIYSWASYEKEMEYNAPILGGVFTTQKDLEDFAKSVTVGNVITLPDTINSVTQAYTTDDCILLGLGTQDPLGTVTGQDNFLYTVQPTMYRICGYDEGGQIILLPVTMEDGYRIASRYTQLINNYTKGYKWNNGAFEDKDFVTI